MAPQPTGQLSGRHPPSLTRAREFALAGPSDLPDPAFSAYRRDLADVALAGQVIASHFVDPVDCTLIRSAAFRSAPNDDAELIADLDAGEQFRLLESKLGWGWGYAGAEDKVGYVKADALGLS